MNSNIRPKLLVLTPRFPFPVIGGDRLRIYNICKELSRLYQITLLSLCETPDEMLIDVSDDNVFSRIERVYLPKWKSYLNCIMALPTKIPLQVAYYTSTDFKNKVNMLLGEHDLVLAHLIRSGHYLRGEAIPKILEMTDAISLNYERVSTVARFSGFKNFVYSLEQRRLKNFEREIAKEFDITVLVSSVDKDYLFPPGNSSRDKVIVCSNGVNFEKLPCDYQPDGKTIIFIGNMTTVQNIDAARWFATKVMPELVKFGPFRFKIIGRINKDVQDEFNSYVNTIATGSVENISESAKGAIAGVCPVRLGAGIQNKILEYMALGIPAITSTIGLEGIDAEVDKEILVADKEEEYIKLITRISKDSEWSRDIGLNGCEYVKKFHNWSDKLQPLLQGIGQLIGV